jgi:D-alanyl-D-alanine carboxypeptidase
MGGWWRDLGTSSQWRVAGPLRAAGLGLALGAALLTLPEAAHAQIGSDRYSSIVIDAATGKVLSADNPDALREPASLTKLMTLYMLFEALRDHRVSIDQQVPVSAHAASMEPTKLGIVPGTDITVEQAIEGIVTLSANDAASAIGEMLGGGSEDRFAQMMTLRAHALGMTNTTFQNASGLPDPPNWTTARDLGILVRHLITDFPDEYHYFSVPSFIFHGRAIYNHDTMLKVYPGADGLKTGWIKASGHNLATSAVRDNVRLIGIVLGAGSNWERDQDMAAQLDQGYESEGVPVMMVHREPSLIAAAHAAPIPRAAMRGVPVRFASARTELRPQHLPTPPRFRPVVEVAEAPERPVHRIVHQTRATHPVTRGHIEKTSATRRQEACPDHDRTGCLRREASR